LEAFKTVLNKIDSLEIKQIYCLGDIVGYGANPKKCIELIKERNILCVKGNHDYAVVSGDTKRFNPLAADVISRTIGMLDEKEKKYLDSLPEKIVLKLQDYKIYLVHGSPINAIWEYVYEDSDLEYLVNYTKSNSLVMGHTHIPFIKRIGDRFVVNAGAVGQPRDNNPKASFALFDQTKSEFEIVRLDYDFKTAAEKMLKAGFPQFLAQRLFLGV